MKFSNRQTTTRDTRQATYTPNNLNQYTSRTVPGYVNVLGTATNTATVSLWSKESTALYTSTTRKGDYFRGEIPVNNATGAVWLTITNVAALSNYTGADIVTNIAGSMLLAKTPEAFTYDADGNLTSDSLWTNVWNGENRRITIESRTGVAPVARMKEQWTHLADGRWIERIVSTNNGTSYYPALTNRYVWDNQVLLAVLDHTNGVVVSFLRGLDLSGQTGSALNGTGGVGGVLAVKAGSSVQCGAMANTTHFTCYDGNGNVTALMNAATGTESARYEYGPFAERLRETGRMAKLNPIRFSTQYANDVTGDTKYLFRDLSDGRWLSRDPIGEAGGINHYGFVENQPIGRIDYLGLSADHDNCEIQRKDYEARLKDPKSQISIFWKQLTDGVEGCPLPPLSCACCSESKKGGEYDPSKKAITICENTLSGKGGWSEFGRRLRHELTHAAQHCRKWETASCKDSVCKEIQAYGADGGAGKEDVKKYVLDGVLFSSRCACAKEVVKPWDSKKSCEENMKGHEEEIKKKIQEVFDAIYDKCKGKLGKPEFPEEPKP